MPSADSTALNAGQLFPPGGIRESLDNVARRRAGLHWPDLAGMTAPIPTSRRKEKPGSEAQSSHHGETIPRAVGHD